jgi:ABC-type branched-subunit amino acid transport system ATPase component
VVVEQHLNYAAMVVDRALVMNEGIIRMEVPGDQITERAEEIERIYLGTSLEETGA